MPHCAPGKLMTVKSREINETYPPPHYLPTLGVFLYWKNGGSDRITRVIKMSYNRSRTLKSRHATNIQLTGMKRVNRDLLLAVQSATFAVRFTQRGTRTADAGGRSGEERRGTMERRRLLSRAVRSARRITLFRNSGW